MDSKRKGNLSEAEALAKLLRCGYKVSLPFGDCERYDMILDDGYKLSKVQCKTGRIRDGCIIFNTYSTNSVRRTKKNYVGEVDSFVVYVPESDRLFLIPVEDCTNGEGRIRLAPTKNNQMKNIRWADHYEVNGSIVPMEEQGSFKPHVESSSLSAPTWFLTEQAVTQG